MSRFWFAVSLVLLVSGTGPLGAQDLNLAPKRDFLDLVDPIITEAEREIYKTLPDFESRSYFASIFWYKRDPDPETHENPFRTAYMARHRLALERFGEERNTGDKSDRGRVFLLLGEPDRVDQNRLQAATARPGVEEVWHYGAHELSLRFVYDGFNPQYRLQNREEIEKRFAVIRNNQVLDRAEPYERRPKPMTLPNLGFTKDVEAKAAVNVHQMDFTLDYSFFKGDLNRTELLVGITFRDASDRGVDVQLSAYDPFRNKVREVKKLVQPVNGEMLSFTMPLEPDQYELTLRLEDKDGRRDISERIIDVPRVGIIGQTASSILLAPRLDPIPLFGFDRPKKYVFGTDYFPPRNTFPGFSADRLYLMQHFYGFTGEPEVDFYLDYAPVEARVEKMVLDNGTYRGVFSIPVADIRGGDHHIKSVFTDLEGNQIVTARIWSLGPGEGGVRLLEDATAGDAFTITSPSGNTAADLDRVAVDPGSLSVRRMYVYLNDQLVRERDRAPWSVRIDEGIFSISGENELAIVLDTDRGMLRRTKKLEPVEVKEEISTRVVQIFFNAYNEALEFVSDIDFDKLSVTVDGKPYTPLEVTRVEEPITFCFMIDNSFSMKDSFSANIGALTKFIASMRPEDRGYFVVFNNDYAQFLEPTASKAVLTAVANSLTLQRPNPKFADPLYQENQTYIYDATIAGIHTLLQYAGRTVVLMVSDGVGVEGIYSRNAMLNYARENDTVIYSLWQDNNPRLSEDDKEFLQTEKTAGEKFARKIGLSRFFAKKDARTTIIRRKVMGAAINEGLLEILAKESGGFHYQVYRADRVAIRQYVEDIEDAVQNQFVLTLNLPITSKSQDVEVSSSDPGIEIRNKSKVKVSPNPFQLD